MNKKSQVLIVGGGSIGQRHVRCFLQTGECEVSLCEPDEGKRDKISSEYALQHSYADYDRLPLEKFDVVVVATPAQFHIAQSLAAARAGCHVLCEKPLSNGDEGIQELIDTLRTNNRIGATAYTLRSVTAVRRMKSMIDAGRIGTPRFATASATQYFPAIRPDYRQIYFAREATGGGVLFDMCPHMLNMLEWFLGPERGVSCLKETLVLDGIETDDTAMLNVRYMSGSLAQINIALFGRSFRYETAVHGSDGSLVYDRVKSELSLYTEDSPGAPPVEVEAFPVGNDEPYIEQAKHFLAATRGECDVACTLEEGWQTLSAVFAAQSSAIYGRSEPVHSIQIS